jgi:glutathione S-transferase
MPDLELIGGSASNYVWVCRIALAEKNVPYTLNAARPHTPEVTAIHPLGKIPAMRHGAVTLFESRAICNYVDKAFAGPALVPTDPVASAQTEQWISLINTAIDPVWIRTYFREYAFPTGPDGTPNRDAIAGAVPKMEPHFAIFDHAVASSGHLVGADFTLADAFLMPILYYMNKSPESAALLAQATNLNAYYGNHIERASVKAAIPQSRPGAS